MLTAQKPKNLAQIIDNAVARIVRVACPQRVIFFGSGASGTLSADSDLDFLVIVKGPVHRRQLAQKIYRDLHGIEMPVDIVIATEEDIEQYGDRIGSILHPALSQGQEIYHANE